MRMKQTAVDAFLDALEHGEWDSMRAHYTPDAIFDGTVPQWHFALQGSDKVIEEHKKWFPHRGRLSDVRVAETSEGAVVEFERRWDDPGQDGQGSQEVGIRQAHILRLDQGRIAEHRAHCSGVWDETTLATIEAEAPHL